MELVDLDTELFLKEWKKKRRAHIQKIVDASLLTEQEKEWMEEYASHSMYNDTNRDVERVVMPNLFDMHRIYHD
jgi:hypothetical protein